jgi:hypothetical protein
MQELIDRADRERFRRVAERVEEQATWKKAACEAREKSEARRRR